MNDLISKIERWCKERDLHTADPTKQMVKLTEEVGELAQGIFEGDGLQLIDSIGNTTVALIALSMQIGFDYEQCVEIAYDKIKDRKSKKELPMEILNNIKLNYLSVEEFIKNHTNINYCEALIRPE